MSQQPKNDLPENPADIQARVDAALKCCIYFFDDFCREAGIAETDKHFVVLEDFAVFLHKSLVSYSAEHLAKAAGVDEEYAQWFIELPGKPYFGNVLTSVWLRVVLAKRSHRYPVEFMLGLVIVQYRDGVVAPFSTVAHADLLPETLDDALIAHMSANQVPLIAKQIMACPLDKAHDMCKPNAGILDVDNLRVLEALVAEAGHLNESRKAVLMALLSFIRCVLCLPEQLPPEIKAKLQRTKDGDGVARLSSEENNQIAGG